MVSPVNSQIPSSTSHCRSGYRVLTHSSTTDKAKTLAHISKLLGLGWNITTDGVPVGKSQGKELLAA